MSPLTPRQKNLIGMFKSLGIDKTTTVGIMTMLTTSNTREQMENFLIEALPDRQPTEQETLQKLADIVNQT